MYFVRSGASWTLIDTGWAKRGQRIKNAAETAFRAGTRPATVLLAHLHPDHSLRRRPGLYGPPYISTWRWPAARQSIAVLARLEPRVLAPGHGRPMVTGVASALRALSRAAPYRAGESASS
ncbi:hypothetical protein Plo01_46830 [Planobispora longispora]|uniref:Metallo-beta-lactamase domain-containing protein n=1 Tax=Planobispora longispora TaxID=28887 RepID=A0A8J3RNL2_9ACTN|nr:hypothetical protein GCM10020093_020050 [Planobispora longispora]GIH78254.1 hypothetical protein Plo01_46830 [Planobispora longispora]